MTWDRLLSLFKTLIQKIATDLNREWICQEMILLGLSNLQCLSCSTVYYRAIQSLLIIFLTIPWIDTVLSSSYPSLMAVLSFCLLIDLSIRWAFHQEIHPLYSSGIYIYSSSGLSKEPNWDRFFWGIFIFLDLYFSWAKRVVYIPIWQVLWEFWEILKLWRPWRSRWSWRMICCAPRVV